MLKIKNEGIFIYHLIFGSLNLYYGYNDLSCVTRPATPFTLQTWLLVDGYMELIVACELLVLWIFKMVLVCTKREEHQVGIAKCLAFFAIFTALNYLLGIMFRFAWMIVGAVIFWGELNQLNLCNTGTAEVGTYMWVYLIILGVYYGIMVLRGLFVMMISRLASATKTVVVEQANRVQE